MHANDNSYANAHPRKLLTAASQQSSNAITLQSALASGTNPASLRAVADWNDRKSYEERRRKSRARHKGQAAALRVVADDIESMLQQASYGLKEAA